MVGREVEVLPGKSLLFTWRGKRKLFELLKVRTERQFAEKMAKLGLEDKLDDDLIIKIFQIGFNWKKDVTATTPEETEDIIEEFCRSNGFGIEEVHLKLLDAFCESGIYDKDFVKAGMKKYKTELKELSSGGSDTGEAGQTSTLMS